MSEAMPERRMVADSNWVLSAVALVCVLMSAWPSFARDYTLECAENYPDGVSDLPNSCDNTDSLDSEIGGWSGWNRRFYWKESLAWPQDWMEANRTPSGLDNIWVDDTVELAVWSGHGTGASNEPNGSWSMSFGSPHGGTRFATSPDAIHLGEASGDPFGGNGLIRFVIMDASCSAVLGEIGPVWIDGAGNGGIMMRAHQGLAFKDSPNDSDDRLGQFAEEVKDDGDSNKEAWLDEGESCVLFWCSNSPLVISFDANESAARNRHNNESLGEVLSRPPSFAGTFVWNFIDNDNC
jgi:Family of unknown function (DUF6345)